MIVINLFLSVSRLDAYASNVAANDASFGTAWKFAATAIKGKDNGHNHVRLIRHAKEPDRTRFALTGKLSDVCAALDELAALEQQNAWRCAGV